jgi:hypothetical protein
MDNVDDPPAPKKDLEMAKEASATPRWSKLTTDERRADRERQGMMEIAAKPIHRFKPDWATLAREGIQDRRSRPDE